MSSTGISTSDWIKGISLSLLASVIGGASKLAIRKSWLLEHSQQGRHLLVPVESSDGSASSQMEDLSERSTGNFLLMESNTMRPRRRSSAGTNEGESTDQPSRPCQESYSDANNNNNNNNNNRTANTSLTLQEENKTSDSEDEEELVVPSGSHEHNSMEGIFRSSPYDTNRMTSPNTAALERYHHWLAWCLRGSGMFGMTFLNPLCSVLAMNYASPSILAPFSGLTLVWIVVFSRPVIGETPSWTQVMAASLIVTGEVVVAVFGDHTNDDGVAVKDVIASYRHPPFLLYCICLALWMLLLFRWMKRTPLDSQLNRFAWGVSGGSVTGLQNFLKDSLTLLKADGTTPVLLLIPLLLMAGASAFGGLLLLTACMKRYDAAFSSAMFVGSFVVSASIMSAVHYQTFQHLEDLRNYVLYPTGLVILMSGVYLLVRESRRTQAS